MKLLVNLFCFLFLFSSCANYVQQLHRQLDIEEGNALKRPQKDKFSMYRDGFQGQNKNKVLNSKSTRFLDPQVKRFYDASNAKKRYTADDLTDNDGSGSLWTGQGQANFLFSNNKLKKTGDIVVVLVKSDLKKDIGLELKRAFPGKPVKKSKEADKAATPPAAAAAPAEEKPAENETDKDKTFDKISSVIVEEINQDHILIRGRKEVLYSKDKRVLEVQALVARRDISDEDTVESDNLLETSISVLR